MPTNISRAVDEAARQFREWPSITAANFEYFACDIYFDAGSIMPHEIWGRRAIADDKATMPKGTALLERSFQVSHRHATRLYQPLMLAIDDERADVTTPHLAAAVTILSPLA